MTSHFTRWAIAHAAGGNAMAAAHIYNSRWGTDPGVAAITKAAVAAGTTTGTSWAKPLAEYQAMSSEFVDMLRPHTLLGRLAGLRRVPFNIKFSRATTGTNVGWVGEGKPIAASEMAFSPDSLGAAKIAGIVAITKELAISSEPAAEALVEADLVAATAAFEDAAFLSSDAAGAASPAGVLNGVTPIASTGITLAAVTADLAALVASVTTALVAPAFVMAPRTAAWLAGLGFDDVGPLGGALMGIPVLTTTQAPTETGGSPAVTTGSIVLIDAAEILLAEGGAEVEASENAALQMDGAPSDPVGASAVMTSLWQQNLVGLRMIRMVNWKKRRPGAAGVLVGVPA